MFSLHVSSWKAMEKALGKEEIRGKFFQFGLIC